MSVSSPDSDQTQPTSPSNDSKSKRKKSPDTKKKSSKHKSKPKSSKTKPKSKSKIKITSIEQAKNLLKSLKQSTTDNKEKYEIAKALKPYIVSNAISNEAQRRQLAEEFLSIYKIKNPDILSVIIVFIQELIKLCVYLFI